MEIGVWEAKPPPKRGAGAKPPSLGCFCAYRLAYSWSPHLLLLLLSVSGTRWSPHLKPPVSNRATKLAG